MHVTLALLLICLGLSAAVCSHAAGPSPVELDSARGWARAHLDGAAGGVPFSFQYGGRPSADLLKAWPSRRDPVRSARGTRRVTQTWTDPQTGLAVRCDAVTYSAYPVVEWTLWFRNTGSADTHVLADIRSLDTPLVGAGSSDPVLHHNVGSPANGSDYAPLVTALPVGASKRFGAAGGRPTNTDMSYFNLEWGPGGVIAAVGWPGQWSAEWHRDSPGSVTVTAGQELTRFVLRPGEEVRSPSTVLLWWQAGPGEDWIRGQNLWRRWMMAHAMPRPGGKLPPPQFVASSSRAYEEMKGANEANQIMHIDRYLELGLKLDYWWMDAGWYVQQQGWPQVGTWEVDRARFPRGFKPISNHAHSRGVKILVWFEPERVAAGTRLADEHPDWVLGGKGGGLLDLGRPEVREWLTAHIDKLITENGIDLYRQDFNMDPLAFWRGNDAPDRQGITEIKHVMGYLAFWDALRQRHPRMLIDSCASGGRRNDLETMRRSVPLWRSDYAYEAIGHQGMTYGISTWLPYHGTGTVACDGAPYYGGGPTPIQPYAFWSNAAPSLGSGVDVREAGIDYASLRKLVNAWRKLSANYVGDFYPLTPYSRAKDAWMAWQFDRPEKGQGAVQAFRRAECPTAAVRLRLRGIDAGSDYVVTDLATGKRRTVPGRELKEAGLDVACTEKPGAVNLLYRRAP